MDTISGKTADGKEAPKKEHLLEMTVECPKHSAQCLAILVKDCEKCSHHRGVDKITTVRGVDIYDVICVFPFRRRVTRLIRETREVPDGSSE